MTARSTSRTIIVGDVHGCYGELRQLLLDCNVREGDRLVFCGDLVDKGPLSASVVQHARQLRDAGLDVTLVMGNHEEKHSRWRRHVAAGGQNPMSDKDGRFTRLLGGLSHQDTAFLDSAVLYAPVPGGIVAHAGVTPGITILPVPYAQLGDLLGKEKKLYGQMLRVRHVRGNEMVPLGQETSEDPFWAEIYDGRFGHIWFGHVVFMEDQPRQFPHATGLDLGCVHGGRLAAAILREDEAPAYVTVKSMGGEYTPLRLAAED